MTRYTETFSSFATVLSTSAVVQKSVVSEIVGPFPPFGTTSSAEFSSTIVSTKSTSQLTYQTSIISIQHDSSSSSTQPSSLQTTVLSSTPASSKAPVLCSTPTSSSSLSPSAKIGIGMTLPTVCILGFIALSTFIHRKKKNLRLLDNQDSVGIYPDGNVGSALLWLSGRRWASTKLKDLTARFKSRYKASKRPVRRQLQVDLADEGEEKGATEHGELTNEARSALLGQEQGGVYELHDTMVPSYSRELAGSSVVWRHDLSARRSSV